MLKNIRATPVYNAGLLHGSQTHTGKEQKAVNRGNEVHRFSEALGNVDWKRQMLKPNQPALSYPDLSVSADMLFYALTAPFVRPETIYFCMKMKISSTGMIAITPNAMMKFHTVSYC